MFGGIIRIKGTVLYIDRGEVMRYGIDFPHEGLRVGDSVSIDGACQTAVSTEGAVFFEAIEETLQRTTLGQLEIGQQVNVERSLRLGDEIGGHLLSGHIYCTAKLEKIHGRAYTFALDKTDFIFEKGYIAIDGMSLTVVAVTPTNFCVHLIPETLKYFKKSVGDEVNIEFDQLTVAAVGTAIRMQSKEIKKYTTT